MGDERRKYIIPTKDVVAAFWDKTEAGARMKVREAGRGTQTVYPNRGRNTPCTPLLLLHL